jgi:outer membrane protein assembly factor BamB
MLIVRRGPFRLVLRGCTAVVVTLVLGLAASGVSATTGVRATRLADTYPQNLWDGKNRFNPNESQLNPSNVSRLQSAWTFPYPGGEFFPTPVVDHNVLFEGGYAGIVVALNATTGQLLWTFHAAAPVVVTSAVTGNTVFAGDKSGNLYALNAHTGALLWTGLGGGSEFFDPDYITVSGRYVFTTNANNENFGDGRISAWPTSGCGSATCGPLWTSELGAVDEGPAVADGTVFVASGNDGYLYAFSASGCGSISCTPLWRGTIGRSPTPNGFGSLAISNGIIYVGSGKPGVRAFSTRGCNTSICSPLRRYPTGTSGIGPSALAILKNRLYIGYPALAAYPAACAPKPVCNPIWTDPSISSANVFAANGVIYVDSKFSSEIRAVRASDGQILWSISADGSSANGPIVVNGTLYDGRISGNPDAILAFRLPADTDLALAQPPSITTDATSPHGAIVTFPLPTPSDPDDPTLPTPTCTPPSRSTFPIGTTTVTCSVTDPDDTPSTVTKTFTISVKGAAAQLTDLAQTVKGVGPGTSLADKVQAAEDDLAAGHITATCGTLSAFVNEVDAQSGKSIPSTKAAALIASAQRIQNVLAC